jgi:hypothetical protein
VKGGEGQEQIEAMIERRKNQGRRRGNKKREAKRRGRNERRKFTIFEKVL